MRQIPDFVPSSSTPTLRELVIQALHLSSLIHLVSAFPVKSQQDVHKVVIPKKCTSGTPGHLVF